ncbi:SMP-30/gluconolactonase/LRE family protein [Pseudoduganella albidiflava]|uniref:Gluconolactonase n=1 Tax=Pseudoduganella albidiflava TaxID=321983 RepID=A0A411X1E8_9BURK|nr:SMP-30/gluconolactonase/LRE family protein [Pseudoduganella albidiflava]QBI02758.1 SMP-30/gluconolactonase/LRE family protein [Pseudoduganella albidiflava]GGY56049.1 gluconolactonase [Pseudoduganella albidiflava]
MAFTAPGCAGSSSNFGSGSTFRSTFRFVARTVALATALAALPCGAALAAACGKAPSGELAAQRVAAVQPTHTGPQLYEGPVWIRDALYFSDFSHAGDFPSRIRKLAADGTVSTFLDDSGSNGLAVDAQGNLVAATHKYKALSRYAVPGKARSAIAERFDGKVFNSPNDIAIAADGTLYFTDPDYQKAAAPGGQPVTGIYRVGTDGKVTLVDGTRRNPNGIALSPAGDLLYVNAGDGEVKAYPIADGVPGAGRTFIQGIDGGDGMALDCHGNLYVTEHGARRVRVFSPQGKELATIRVDANVTNAAFGGADGRTLFITGDRALWRIALDVTGKPY